jgi:GH15 family glucan-1,4-alpha-glucosidase
LSYLNLSHYGVIGNHHSIAVISRFGSIDWACLPDLDGPSHFGALVDDAQGGRFSIAPVGEFHSEQHYLQRTLVLETIFETPFGRGVITDWIPQNHLAGLQHPLPIICRKIEVVAGRVQWNLLCSPRFDYGARPARAELRRGGVLFRGTAVDEIAQLTFDEASLQMEDLELRLTENCQSAEARFLLEAGERVQLAWVWGRLPPPTEIPSVEETIEFWRRHAHRCPSQGGCTFAGPWHDAVSRSGLLLKLLTNLSFGSLAAAGTTSLSANSNSRTWDYRFAWLRDNAAAPAIFAEFGNREEAIQSFRWLTDILLRDAPEDLQPVYSIDGGRALAERELPYLSGYQDHRPVRIGNLSARQLELDIYGRLIDSACDFQGRFDFMPPVLWERLASIADHVCQVWRRPDHGVWSCRSKAKHYVSSKLYCWLGLTRAIELAQRIGQSVPHRWRDERAILHRTICDQGFDARLGAFVQSFGSRELDSSNLILPMIGFLPVEDPRIIGTVEAIQAQLCEGVLVRRYLGDDGIPGSEGPHLPSSFQLAAALAQIGRVDEAVDRLAELCAFTTPLGILGEQVDEKTGETSGNFPYAPSHLALIEAARTLKSSKFSLKNLGKLRYR